MLQRNVLPDHVHRFRPLLLAGLAFTLLLLLAACGSQPSGSGNSMASTPAPKAPSLTLTFSCKDTPGMGFFVLGAGTHGRVCVQTLPGALLSITVDFCTQVVDPSRQLKGTVVADTTGYYEWIWKPQTPCGPHIYRGEAKVTAHLQGQSVSRSTSFFGD